MECYVFEPLLKNMFSKNVQKHIAPHESASTDFYTEHEKKERARLAPGRLSVVGPCRVW